jgi:hypothetical protein
MEKVRVEEVGVLRGDDALFVEGDLVEDAIAYAIGVGQFERVAGIVTEACEGVQRLRGRWASRMNFMG